MTNSYRMLNIPSEVAALVKIKLTLIAVRGVSDDPLRATGAVLLHLPAVAKLIRHGKSNVFLLNPKMSAAHRCLELHAPPCLEARPEPRGAVE